MGGEDRKREGREEGRRRGSRKRRRTWIVCRWKRVRKRKGDVIKQKLTLATSLKHTSLTRHRTGKDTLSYG